MKLNLKVPVHFALVCLLAFTPHLASAQPKAKKDKTASKEDSGKSSGKVAPSAPIDLNTASQADLEKLPGVGAATARKIVSGRPYSSVGDLSKAGVSAKTIQAITPMVTVSPATGAGAGKTASSPKAASPGTAAPPTPVDLNTGSQADLEKLPAVGPATARKIIAARPYSSVADLSKAGVPAKTIQTITPMVTVSRAAAAAAGAGAGSARSTPVPAPTPTQSQSPASSSTASTRPTPASSPSATNAQGTSCGPGLVWVNTDTKVFHRAGSRWYGKTKMGKCMSESDAVKAGYRESKQG